MMFYEFNALSFYFWLISSLWNGFSTVIVGAIAGSFAGLFFGWMTWLKKDELDLDNLQRIIYQELCLIEDKLSNLKVKDLSNPFTLIYPQNGRLYDIKISFIRFKKYPNNLSTDLSDFYHKLLEIDEKFRHYQSASQEVKSFLDLKEFLSQIRDLREDIKKIKKKMEIRDC